MGSPIPIPRPRLRIRSVMVVVAVVAVWLTLWRASPTLAVISLIAIPAHSLTRRTIDMDAGFALRLIHYFICFIIFFMTLGSIVVLGIILVVAAIRVLFRIP